MDNLAICMIRGVSDRRRYLFVMIDVDNDCNEDDADIYLAIFILGDLGS